MAKKPTRPAPKFKGALPRSTTAKPKPKPSKSISKAKYKTAQGALAKTFKGKKYLEKREPQIHESTKLTLILKGRQSSHTINDVLTELAIIKKPHAHKLQRKNDIVPFDSSMGQSGLLESLCRKSDCALFVMGSHSKKRPDNLVVGRMFDFQMLDMVEFGVDGFEKMSEVRKAVTGITGVAQETTEAKDRGNRDDLNENENENQGQDQDQDREENKVKSKVKAGDVSLGLKPALFFNGEDYTQSETTQKLKNLFIDFFRGEEYESLDLAGIEHVLVFTLMQNGTKMLLRHYAIKLLKNKKNPKLPTVKLVEVGPRLDLSVRRTQFASEDLYKAATRESREGKERKKKNVTYDNPFGDTLGRVHLGKQDLKLLQAKRPAALRKGGKRAIENPDNSGDEIMEGLPEDEE